MTAPTHRPEARRRMWSIPVLVRYWAMQIPGTVIVITIAMLLAHYFGWSPRAAWIALAAWIVKDAVLYFFVWRAYDPGYLTPFPYRMEGATAVAVQRIERSGTVRLWGELWHAELTPEAAPVNPGQKVRVRACRGMTLVIEPA